MSDRTQSVCVKNAQSDNVPLVYGVPQGYVAGPLLFTLYSAPLQDIITSHGIGNVVYADDTQLYLTFDPEDCDVALKKMEACIADITSWCSSNKLVLDDKKTCAELLHFSSQFRKSTLQLTLAIGDSVVSPSPHARNLGVIMDSSLCMSNQVNSVCKSALFVIRKIRQIRQYLDSKTTETLVHAFVTSRLDSVNSLLFGLPQCELHEDSTCAKYRSPSRLICVPRREHISTSSTFNVHQQSSMVHRLSLWQQQQLSGIVFRMTFDKQKVLRSSNLV